MGKRVCWVVLLLAWPLAGVRAVWAVPSTVPVSRVLAALERRLDDPQADQRQTHYLLGRVHGFAFELGLDRIIGDVDDDGEVWIANTWHHDRGLPESHVTRSRPGGLHGVLDRREEGQRVTGDDPPDVDTGVASALLTEAMHRHLQAGLRHLGEAHFRDQSDPVARLGLAHLLRVSAHLVLAYEQQFVDDFWGPPRQHAHEEQIVLQLVSPDHRVRRVGIERLRATDPDVPFLAQIALQPHFDTQMAIEDLLRRKVLERIVEEYTRVMRDGLADGIEQAVEIRIADTRVFWSLAAFEAAARLMDLALLHDLPDEADLLRECRDVVRALEDAMVNATAVTPVLIHTCDRADVCLDPRGRVAFDLDADGRRDVVDWPAPCSRLLVWRDGVRDDRPLDGRGLFGNVTWWLFFAHGFQPLALLDDDGDGWLRGGELDGLALWEDGGEPAVLEDGELLDLAAAGVDALSVNGHAPSAHGDLLAPDGACFNDGTRHALVDWFAEVHGVE